MTQQVQRHGGDATGTRGAAAALEPDLPHEPTVLGATGPFMLRPLGWTMDMFAEAGFTAVEVLFTHTAESRDPDKICNYARLAGLTVPVVHGPYMLFLRTVFSSNYTEKTRRSLELADEVGASTVVAHAPMRWERVHAEWARSEAADEAAQRQLRFAMENLFPVWGVPFSSVVAPEELSDYRHVVFDTSHFAVAGIDLFQAWHMIGDRVTHLHVSNNLGNGKDSHAPLGAGVLPLDRFLAHVGRSGYTGTVTLELDVRPYIDDRDELIAFLRRERQLADRWLSGDLTHDEDTAEAERLADELARDEARADSAAGDWARAVTAPPLSKGS